MTRLFVALPVPETLRQGLALVSGGLDGARWVAPEDYHVTLRFIGDVDNREADRIAAALEAVEGAPFEAEVDNYASFGGDQPRTVHLALKVTPPLAALQHQVEMVCRAAGLEPESRRFSPHVTLGRLRRVKGGEVARWLSARSLPMVDRFPVDRFCLYVARPGGGGPYHPAVTYDLGG